MYQKQMHLHFVGIGGIGMSGIATILRHQGYIISGCDNDVEQKSIIDLRKLGCIIAEGNNTSLCCDPTIDIVIYSSAIKKDNPEIVRAQQRGTPTISRALMLAELMRTKFSIAIAGAHGKTTTTSLISHILLETEQDPTIIIGGHLHSISTNARFGKGDFLVAEADESDRSLAHLQATLAVVTNIDLEHLETYTDLDDIKNTFQIFLSNLPFYGKAIVCADDEHVRSILPRIQHVRTIKYGIEHDADIVAYNIELGPLTSTFSVRLHAQELGQVTLNMPGKHNVLNALAALALTNDLEIPFEKAAQALSTFNGVDRRFTFKGVYYDAEFFDDYGHHPKEIYNTLLIAEKRKKEKLIMVFQPHRYSRTECLWDDFVDLFQTSSIDHLIITDIFPASEAPREGVTSERLVKAIAAKNPHMSVHYAPFDNSFLAIKTHLESVVQKDDMVLLQGAGKLNKLIGYIS